MSPTAALRRLLADCFEPDDFRRLLDSSQELRMVLDDLPGPNVSPNHFFHAVVGRLDEHALVGRVLFDLLREARPRRVNEINTIEALWSKHSLASKRRVEMNGLIEHLPEIAGSVVFVAAFTLAWRWPGRALMLLGIYLLCLLLPWAAVRNRIALAITALVCGSTLVSVGASLEVRKVRPPSD